MEKLDVEVLKKLGKFTRQLREEVSKIPKSGVTLLEIVDFVEKKIFDAGYLPAFPCTVCLNDIAAHYTIFDEDYVLKRGDLLKIDFGVSENGFITDTAFTVEIDDGKCKDLIDANIRALNEAVEFMKVGASMNEIGKIVFDVASSRGFNTIHNLSGHEIARDSLHAGLHVPNCDNSDLSKIKENMELAIEPFFTLGDPMVKTGGLSNILHLKREVPIRDKIAKSVYSYIVSNFPKLPFSKRWLLDQFDKRKVLYALKVLKSVGAVFEYEILKTVDGAYVSQFEDTVVFDGDKKIVITRL